MHSFCFTSEDKSIHCTLTVKSNVPKDKIDPIFKSLMLHLETSIGVYPNKPIFENITKLRGEFYSAVLKFLVDENLNNGREVPTHILQHLSNKDKSSWSYDDD